MVIWNVMRGKLGRVLLALVVLFTQFHACQETYVNRTGSKCFDCVRIFDPHLSLTSLEAPHGDCHDCCEIKDCELPDDLTATSVSLPVGFVAILPSPVPSINWRIAVEAAASPPVFLTQAPPTGPPSSQDSRAPPFFGLS